MANSLSKKSSLNFWINLSDSLNWIFFSSTSWYWLFWYVMIYYLILVDASLSMMSRVYLYTISDKYLVSLCMLWWFTYVILTLSTTPWCHWLHESIGKKKYLLPFNYTQGNDPVKYQYVLLENSCPYTMYDMMYVFLVVIYYCFGVTYSVL